MRVFIADDEKLGRLAVRRLLERDERFEIVGEAADGLTAIKLIEELSPDVVFLDVQMPGCDGLEVARRCSSPKPLIVFVTAHDEHAIQAFERAAIDYVVKPLDADRFGQTLARLWDREIQRKDAASEPAAISGRMISLHNSGRTLVFSSDDLLVAEAAGNYVNLKFEHSEERMRTTMASLMDKLIDTDIVRVHRAFAVGLRHVRELRTTDGSHGAQLILSSGATVPVGRTFRNALAERLDQFCK